jgi:predicted MFS family arabinose efflux permease
MLGTSHQFAVQSAAPHEVRGLATSFYSMTLQGSIALGSAAFGVLARYTGVSRSILVAGLLASAGLLLVRRFPIPQPQRSAA